MRSFKFKQTFATRNSLRSKTVIQNEVLLQHDLEILFPVHFVFDYFVLIREHNEYLIGFMRTCIEGHIDEKMLLVDECHKVIGWINAKNTDFHAPFIYMADSQWIY